MADYYTMYSLMLPTPKGARAEVTSWVDRIGKHAEFCEEHGLPPADTAWFVELSESERHFLKDVFEQGGARLGVVSMHRDGVWLRSEDSCNIELVAKFVQIFLQRFSPEDSVVVEWASSCSRMRLDGFGGGFCVVRANRMTWSPDPYEYEALTLLGQGQCESDAVESAGTENQ